MAMSTTGSTIPYSYACLHTRTHHKFQTFSLNPNYLLTFSKRKDGCRLLGNGGSRSIGLQSRNMAVCSSVQPGPPIPSGPPSNSWKPWIVGMLLTMILPFLKNKWGSLLKLKNEIETVVETAETIAEVVEKAAEKVEKVAEEVADKLPQGELKDAAIFIENVAQKTAKDAYLADEFIDKVQEVEERMESFIEPVIGQANEFSKEKVDQN